MHPNQTTLLLIAFYALARWEREYLLETGIAVATPAHSFPVKAIGAMPHKLT